MAEQSSAEKIAEIPLSIIVNENSTVEDLIKTMRGSSSREVELDARYRGNNDNKEIKFFAKIREILRQLKLGVYVDSEFGGYQISIKTGDSNLDKELNKDLQIDTP